MVVSILNASLSVPFTDYDHNLIQIEKGKLLDHISGQAVIEGFGTTPGTKPTTNSERKTNDLISLLQINPEEISKARERLNEINEELEYRNNPEVRDAFRVSDKEYMDAAVLNASLSVPFTAGCLNQMSLAVNI